MEVARGETQSRNLAHATTVASVRTHNWRSMTSSWPQLSIKGRIAVLRRARSAMAARSNEFADAISSDLARTKAETRVAELLPLIAACKYLEQNAKQLLATQRLGRRGLPFWLSGVDSEVQRVPFGTVLLIGPSNYPLFLPGVQALQALVAGNQVIWKPGRGGRAVADLFADLMIRSGLPATALRVTEDTVEAGEEALHSGVDKVIFTGSGKNARKVLRTTSELLIPCIVEASGCDAVVVLESADLTRVVKALAFGMRINGSATCMAPRRIILVGASVARRDKFETALVVELKKIAGVRLPEDTRRRLQALISDAVSNGAVLHGKIEVDQLPVLVTNVAPKMEVTRCDIFAPLLSMIEVDKLDDVLEVQAACPFGLTAAIFGDERQARTLAARLTVGTVVINDLIVATADPRIPFGGRRESGFGVTRGAEGLLEMTTSKVILARRGSGTRQYDPTGPTHEDLFDGMIAASHARSLKDRWQGVRRMIHAGRELGRRK
jgi:acyl-CoA reductase-like NAD-dependent aldehyde dehydrogenase